MANCEGLGLIFLAGTSLYELNKRSIWFLENQKKLSVSKIPGSQLILMIFYADSKNGLIF